MPELRRDPLTQEQVIIAPERAKRPGEYHSLPLSEHRNDCPFCQLKDEEILELSPAGEWQLIKNLYPACLPLGEQYPQFSDQFEPRQPAIGDHFILVNKMAEPDLTGMSVETVTDLLLAIQSICQRGWQESGWQNIVCFYNHGPAAGASLRHPHAQIIATNWPLPRLESECQIAEQHWQAHGVNLYDQLLDQPMVRDRLILNQLSQTTWFTQPAARFPFASLIYSTVAEADFGKASSQIITETGQLLSQALNAYEKLLPGLSLNLVLHTMPLDLRFADSYRWHIEILPRLAIYGGFELSTDTIIDIIAPEKAAQELRRCLDSSNN